MARPSTDHRWWNIWDVTESTEDSFTGYLPTYFFDPSDGWAIGVVRVTDLRPGDPDPRHPAFTVTEIRRVMAVDGEPDVHHISTAPSPDSDPYHPAHWLDVWPLGTDRLEDVADFVDMARTSINLPSVPDRPAVKILESEGVPDGWISPWRRS